MGDFVENRFQMPEDLTLGFFLVIVPIFGLTLQSLCVKYKI
jgi:hypothetical protein